MKLFEKKRELTVDQAVKSSNRVVDVFSDLIAQLQGANEKLSSARVQDEEEKERIEENMARATWQEAKNDIIINRIYHIIGE